MMTLPQVSPTLERMDAPSLEHLRETGLDAESARAAGGRALGAGTSVDDDWGRGAIERAVAVGRGRQCV